MSSEVKLFIHIDDDKNNNVSQRLDECPEKALGRCSKSERTCQWTLLSTVFVCPFQVLVRPRTDACNSDMRSGFSNSLMAPACITSLRNDGAFLAEIMIAGVYLLAIVSLALPANGEFPWPAHLD